VDHAVFAEAGARLVLPALRTLGAPRVRVGLALMGGDPRRVPAASAPASLAAESHVVARELGIQVLRSGSGRLDAVYVDRFAAPGRVSACAGGSMAAVGAIGALVLECGELELAAVLAGAPRFVRDDGVLGIRLQGSPAPFVSGQDVACEIARRLAPSGAGGRIVEFAGNGIPSLSIPDRMIVAGTCAEWGAAAALFPADDVTRAWLLARGRPSDWRKWEAAEEGADEWLEVDLGEVEPQFAELGRPDTARPLPGGPGAEVRHVRIGPAATAVDLIRFARWLKGRELPNGMMLTVAPGSRERLEAVEREGALQDLMAQGAILEAAGATRAAAAEPMAGIGYGMGAAELEDPRTRWWAASLESCAAAALSGRLSDPRRVLTAVTVEEPELLIGLDSGVLGARSESEAASGTALPAVPCGAPFAGPVRGRVLLRCGDGTGTDQVLPWGARVAPLAGDILGLRAHAFATLDPGFTARALASAGGFVVAGEGFGKGVRREAAALVLVALGVRAVIARSFDPVFRRRLLEAGALPLSFARGADLDAFAAGDEIELPTLPHGLEPSRPLVVRDLTRGTQLDVRHELDARAIAIARSGGLLNYAAAIGPDR
jgi:homoaconitase/3-isopropylmalate dehydratase large subunit